MLLQRSNNTWNEGMQMSKATCFTEVMPELLKIVHKIWREQFLSFSIYSLKLEEDDKSVQPNSRNKQTTAKLHILSTRIKLKCKHQTLCRGAKVNENIYYGVYGGRWLGEGADWGGTTGGATLWCNQHMKTEISYPLLHTLDYEAQVFTHLLLAQVLLFTSLDVEKKTENI